MVDADHNTLNGPITVDDVLLFPSPTDPATLLYVPARPIPQAGGKGSPAVSVVRTPKAVMLQAGALFTLGDQETTALVKHLVAAKLATLPRLQPAPIAVVKASLLLADNTGKAREIAYSSSSLYPPFSAIFSATLSAADGAIAIAAINGRTGVLIVEYRFTLPDALARQGGSSTGVLSRRADVASWFPAGSGAAHIQISG